MPRVPLPSPRAARTSPADLAAERRFERALRSARARIHQARERIDKAIAIAEATRRAIGG
jgi:hypothetical protein